MKAVGSMIPLLPTVDASGTNAELLAIDITLRHHFKGASKAYLKDKWAHKDPLHPDNAKAITRVRGHAASLLDGCCRMLLFFFF